MVVVPSWQKPPLSSTRISVAVLGQAQQRSFDYRRAVASAKTEPRPFSCSRYNLERLSVNSSISNPGFRFLVARCLLCLALTICREGSTCTDHYFTIHRTTLMEDLKLSESVGKNCNP